MKLLLVASLLSLFFACAASAEVPTVEHMTCRQAQAYADKYGRYWKDAGVDGAIPIYPVTGLRKANCGGRTTTTPQWEQTLDNRHCIVGWYCRSY